MFVILGLQTPHQAKLPGLFVPNFKLCAAILHFFRPPNLILYTYLTRPIP